MTHMHGKLFVIEGLDGSGKQTQSNMLYERLINQGYQIIKKEYPNYKSESSSLVKMYLRGDFGNNPEDVSPYISSTFFAADRYASYKTEYETYYMNGGLVITDRYTTSNMVHQASKIHDNVEKEKFLSWLWELEFNIYKIPVPTQVFFLDVKPEIAIEMMKNRDNKFSNKKQKDIHEINRNHLQDSYENALYLVEKYNWEKIECSTENGIKSLEEINQILYDKFIPYL